MVFLFDSGSVFLSQCIELIGMNIWIGIGFGVFTIVFFAVSIRALARSEAFTQERLQQEDPNRNRIDLRAYKQASPGPIYIYDYEDPTLLRVLSIIPARMGGPANNTIRFHVQGYACIVRARAPHREVNLCFHPSAIALKGYDIYVNGKPGQPAIIQEGILRFTIPV